MTSTISVSYKSLLLNVTLPEKLPIDSLKTISVTTTNSAGEFQPAKLTVIISKLKQEKRLIRNRYWQRPDQFTMSKEEYIKLFPNDVYDNEKDYRGREVKDIKYVELYDAKSNQLIHPEYLWTEGSKPIEPGEKTTIKIGSSADNIYLIQQIDRSINDQLPATNYKLQTLNSEKKTFEFTASESDRGGYGVNYFFVKNNRFYEYNDIINVPWTNKDLKIEYATFRDKTLPGSDEKWKLKITGYKNEKVAAEMLASMYDASLDQFKPHNWYNPSFFVMTSTT